MARPAPIPTTTRPVLILRALNDNYVQDDTLLAPLTTALGDQLEVIGLDSAQMIYWEAPTQRPQRFAASSADRPAI